MTKTLWKIALILVAIPVLAMAAIVADGLTDNLRKADVAIVLGNTIDADGTPSPWLEARLERTAELYKAGLFDNVIVSGGPETNGYDEASIMRTYLIMHGISEGLITVDSKGVNTMATARNAAVTMKANGWNSAMVISQYYHITRARFALKALGVRTVYSAHAHRFEAHDLFAIPRELAANISYRWRLR